MTVYAPVPAYADRKRHPAALILIVSAHAALLAAVMSVKMDLPIAERFPPTVIDFIDPKPPEPAPNPPPKDPQQQSVIPRTPQIVPIPPLDAPDIDVAPLPLPDPGPVITPGPSIEPQPKPAPVRTGPRFATPPAKLRPPYPLEKRRLEEEAVLRLRLAIDERGRVTAVDAVGPADPVFLASARRHLLGNWRYQPATEDGRPVASSTVITLRFELSD